MYKVVWWDAYGTPCISEAMSKDKADIFRASLYPVQEGRLVYVNV